MTARARSLICVVIATALLAACADHRPTGAPRRPSSVESPSPAPSPAPSRQSRFGSIREALAFIGARVDVPVLIPSNGLPPGIRLANVHPVSVSTESPGGPVTATLALRYGGDGFLRISYGAPRFATGCEEETTVKEVRVDDYPALLGISRDHSDLVWPATFRKLQGRYRLSGSFSGAEILRLAASMRPVPGLTPAIPPPAC